MVISQIDAFIEGKSIIVVICSYRNNNAQHLIKKNGINEYLLVNFFSFFRFPHIKLPRKIGKNLITRDINCSYCLRLYLKSSLLLS